MEGKLILYSIFPHTLLLHFSPLIPTRYLHAAYTNPIFVRTCPCDQEITLHWHDRPETPKLSHKKHAVIAKEKPKFSFDVPVRASVITVVEADD